MVDIRKYTIVLVNTLEPGLSYNAVVQKHTFPEAASKAYSIKNKLGHEWRIINVKENIKSKHPPDSSTLNTVSLS